LDELLEAALDLLVFGRLATSVEGLDRDRADLANLLHRLFAKIELLVAELLDQSLQPVDEARVLRLGESHASDLAHGNDELAVRRRDVELGDARLAREPRPVA